MKILLFSFGFLVLCSCWSPFPNAYERSMQVGRFRPNINTGIAKKVNINGYYVVTHKRVGTFEPFILYSDGTFGNIVFKNRDSLYEQKKQDTDLMQEIISSEKGFCGGGGYYETKVSHPLKRSLFSFAFACGPPYPLSFNTWLIEVMQSVHVLHPIFPMLPPLQGF